MAARKAGRNGPTIGSLRRLSLRPILSTENRLELHWFLTLADARRTVEQWRLGYKSALGGKVTSTVPAVGRLMKRILSVRVALRLDFRPRNIDIRTSQQW